MKKLLIIGFGKIAEEIVNHFKPSFLIYATTGSKEKFNIIKKNKIIPILCDLDDPKSLREKLKFNVDYIIHLCPPQKNGQFDRRTYNMISALRLNLIKPQKIVYLSTSGVYGDKKGKLVDESDKLLAKNNRSLKRICAEKIIRSWCLKSKIQLNILRVPGIYNKSRLPIDFLKKKYSIFRKNEDSYTNHIHSTDLSRAVILVLFKGKNFRIFNICDNSNLLLGDYFDLLCNKLKIDNLTREPRSVVRKKMPANTYSFISDSKRLKNDRVKREINFKLKYEKVNNFFDYLENK